MSSSQGYDGLGTSSPSVQLLNCTQTHSSDRLSDLLEEQDDDTQNQTLVQTDCGEETALSLLDSLHSSSGSNSSRHSSNSCCEVESTTLSGRTGSTGCSSDQRPHSNSFYASRSYALGTAYTTDCSLKLNTHTHRRPPSSASSQVLGHRSRQSTVGRSASVAATSAAASAATVSRPKHNRMMSRNRIKYCRLAHYVDLAWFQCLACVALLLFLNRLFELNKDIAYLKHVSNVWLPNISIPSSSVSTASLPTILSGNTATDPTTTTPTSVTAQLDGIQREIELAKAKSAHFHVENLRKDVDTLIGKGI